MFYVVWVHVYIIQYIIYYIYKYTYRYVFFGVRVVGFLQSPETVLVTLRMDKLEPVPSIPLCVRCFAGPIVTISNKKLLVAPGSTARNKKLLGHID